MSKSSPDRWARNSDQPSLSPTGSVSRIANATGVDIRLSYLDADLGEGLLETASGGDGEYLAADAPINIAGPYQLEVAVRRPDTFDARTAFRFEVASGGRRQQFRNLPVGGHRTSSLRRRARRARLHVPCRRHPPRGLVFAPRIGRHDPWPHRVHGRSGYRLYRSVRGHRRHRETAIRLRPTRSRSP